MRAIRIGLIGDYDSSVKAHRAIPIALAMAGEAAGCEVEAVWLPTEMLVPGVERELEALDGLWCVPASPYVSMEGALLGIRFARETGKPFLGTCGGFQHALIEYARNVLGLWDADHAESNPGTTFPLISPLACALRDQSGAISLKEGTRIREIYGASTVVEEYNCSFGLAPNYRSFLEGGPLTITGEDTEGEVRVVELLGHPFFIATLFQPERRALKGEAHPLVNAYVRAIVEANVAAQPA
jgi:CTP synthase (UTP-ammonia lyase)